MNLEEAEKKLWADKEVKDRTGEGYYLSSLLLMPPNFTEIDKWQFVFFHPDTKDVFTASVNEKGILVGEESKPLVEDNYEKLDLKGAEPEKVLKIVQGETKHLDSNQVTKIIITLRDTMWRAAITTSDLKLLRIDIDRNTHEVEKSETTSMLR